MTGRSRYPYGVPFTGCVIVATRRDHDVAEFARHRDAFDRVSVEAPWMEVDTTDGYKPGLDEIVRFVNSLA